MPEKLTDERLREIAAGDPYDMVERVPMARELLALRDHGEAAPEPYGAIGHHPEMGQRWVSADRLRHYQEHGDWELTLLYPAPPQETPPLSGAETNQETKGNDMTNETIPTDLTPEEARVHRERDELIRDEGRAAERERITKILDEARAKIDPKESPDAK